jgi:hypothetical protein
MADGVEQFLVYVAGVGNTYVLVTTTMVYTVHCTPLDS